MKDILKKLRKYEIRIRKAINTQMRGDYHSIFKGSGLEFDDVRGYQYGDDIRSIDWNVSAKGHGAFVKTFKEEREQSVFFLLDMSGSQDIGQDNRRKLDVSKEICGVLALASIHENSQVGVIGFSDQKELYVKTGKGKTHAYHLINKVFKHEPISRKTDLKGAINQTLGLLKKKSVVIFISDFIDDDYEKPLKSLARIHDLVVIHIADLQETLFPKLGILPVRDVESGKTVWVNTSSRSFKKNVSETFLEKKGELEQICRKNQANYIKIMTDQDYVPELIKLFKTRNRKKKSG